jgi:hypothetical protein
MRDRVAQIPSDDDIESFISSNLKEYFEPVVFNSGDFE